MLLLELVPAVPHLRALGRLLGQTAGPSAHPRLLFSRSEMVGLWQQVRGGGPQGPLPEGENATCGLLQPQSHSSF